MHQERAPHVQPEAHRRRTAQGVPPPRRPAADARALERAVDRGGAPGRPDRPEPQRPPPEHGPEAQPNGDDAVRMLFRMALDLERLRPVPDVALRMELDRLLGEVDACIRRIRAAALDGTQSG
jgi:hypothetical protein